MNRYNKNCLSNHNWLAQQDKMIKKKIERVKKYNDNPKLCIVCKKIISYDKRINKFCSCKCSAKFNMEKRKISYICKQCGKQIDNKYGQKRYFCSHQCHKNNEYDNYIKKWKEETVLENRYHISNFIRKYIFKKYNDKCCKCGWSEINLKSKKIPLQINHIDGNYKNCKEENLELLCPNCHSLTPNFGALNIGSGRERRRNRYTDGKTY